MELSSSFNGSMKRAKARGGVAQVAHCLVDGCNSDLSLCRDYHRRHKVCEIHSKTAKVTIGGREQRFCQQCSRFHSLVEFDEGKRSCRKRLDGHNRRRRKSQPDSLCRNAGRIFHAPRGVDSTRILSFRSPQTPPGTSVSSCAGLVKAEHDIMMYLNQQRMNVTERQDFCPDYSARSFKAANQPQFPQDRDVEPSGRGYDSQKMLSDGLYRVINANHALSLLSPALPLHRDFGLKHLEQFEPFPETRSLLHNLHFTGLNQYTLSEESKPAVSAMDVHCGDAATFCSSDTFQHRHEGSSTSGAHQTSTFTM